MFSRYSDPFALLQGMISVGRLEEFVCELVNIRNEELNERTMWEYYIHRVYDRSFSDFVGANESSETPEVDMNEIEATVKRSMEILNDFRIE